MAVLKTMIGLLSSLHCRRLWQRLRGVITIVAELLRLAFAWGVMGAIVWFWYWLLSNIGTF